MFRKKHMNVLNATEFSGIKVNLKYDISIY